MKVFIALFVCIVAVFGGEEGSEIDKRKSELLQQSAKACVLELKLDPKLIYESPLDGTPPSIDYNGCYYACVDQKMGVMNKDGTYNLEHILKFTGTAEERQRAENMFNNKMKECSTIVGKNPCKMAACVHKLPKP